MVVALHGRDMACENQTRPHCVNQMRKTQSKPLAERHGRGTAWYVCISLKSVRQFSGLLKPTSGRHWDFGPAQSIWGAALQQEFLGPWSSSVGVIPPARHFQFIYTDAMCGPVQWGQLSWNSTTTGHNPYTPTTDSA
jgi:hypothetical protein